MKRPLVVCLAVAMALAVAVPVIAWRVNKSRQEVRIGTARDAGRIFGKQAGRQLRGEATLQRCTTEARAVLMAEQAPGVRSMLWYQVRETAGPAYEAYREAFVDSCTLFVNVPTTTLELPTLTDNACEVISTAKRDNKKLFDFYSALITVKGDEYEPEIVDIAKRYDGEDVDGQAFIDYCQSR